MNLLATMTILCLTKVISLKSLLSTVASLSAIVSTDLSAKATLAVFYLLIFNLSFFLPLFSRILTDVTD